MITVKNRICKQNHVISRKVLWYGFQPIEHHSKRKYESSSWVGSKVVSNMHTATCTQDCRNCFDVSLYM